MILIGEVRSISIFGKFTVNVDDIVRLFWHFIFDRFIVIDDDIMRLFWPFYIWKIHSGMS